MAKDRFNGRDLAVYCDRPRLFAKIWDLGGYYFHHRDKAKVAQRLARRLKDLAYDVDLRVAAA